MAHLAKMRYGYLLFLLLSVILSACNLSNSPEQQLALTEIATNTSAPTRTLLSSNNGLPTTLPITQVAAATTKPLSLPATSISLPPTFAPFPTSTPTPISIVILSPIPGNVVAGNVQVLGAAIHPLFLQYQLEYGPDPNPGNLWYPASGISQNPVFNGLLGIWNTTLVQDSVYQLRLRVTLRDGTSLATVVNNIRIQNQAPTPVPSATPNIPRPIAAFTEDRTTGQAPLVVRFINQSSGNISNFSWSFGDGGSSAEANPVYTFRTSGVFYVTLQVNGPGGSSNVTQQINVQTPNAPVAAFTQDKTSGPSPLTVKFTNQSTGIITNYNWAFGDGTTSTDPNPTHQFSAVGTYNVILGLAGPGGTSFVTRKITVQDPVIPAPVAAFAPDKTTGNIPLVVQFANQSTGQITSFAWDFGDGQTSVEKNPVHTFIAAGEFTVKLTAIGPGGQKVAQTKITAVKPPDAPVAGFTQSTASGNTPLTVQFTNKSTGQISSYTWDFGDGSPVSTDKDPSHVYNTVGTFTVKLKVTGAGGTSEAQSTVTSTKPIAAPVAAFTVSPTSGTAALPVQFTNQSAGESLTYSWDFGDGSPVSTDANPSHTYANAGKYDAKLTVTNSAGSNTSAPQTITVSAPAVVPVASFTMDKNSGNAPLTVIFTSTSTGDFNTLTWTFANALNNVVGTSTGPTTSFTFPTVGKYTATLKVDGLGGSNTSAPQIVTVSAAPVAPVASFTADKTTGNAPLTVTFTSTSTGDNLTYSWDFGDGSPVSTDANPSHTYTSVGTYAAKLTVTNSAGSNTSAPQTITVSAAPVAPVASFTMDKNSGNAPLTVIFTSTSTGDFNTLTWTFANALNNVVGTSTGPTTSFTFPTVGKYTATLKVDGLGGSNTSAPQTITVSAAPVAPVANFTADKTTGNAPLTVTFTSTSTGDNLTYSWDFGDGSPVSTDANPSHTYASVGTYAAKLTVSNNGGSNTSAPQTITVSAAPVVPVASFTMDKNSGNAPLNVIFTSTSTGDFNTLTWTFANALNNVVGTSTGPTTSFTFPTVGKYTATLKVDGLGGSNTSAPQTITVSAAPVAPVASFTANPISGTAPLDVTFTSTSTGDFDTLAWSFADASNNVLGTANTPTTTFTFPAAGTYTATLTVSGSGGSNASAPQTITVNAAVVPPVAGFTMDTNTGTAPLTVNFTNASTGDNLTYTWDFGDSSPVSTDANTSHVYSQAGTYNVTLTATNSAGTNTTAPQMITVNAAVVPPVAAFTPDTNTGTAPLTVNFTNASTGDNLTYTWDFGDSSPVSTDANPSHVYSQAGTYNVTLTATNSAGTNTTAPQTITVNSAPVAPVASFTMDSNTGTAPLTVNFTSTSTGDFDTLAWSFADASNNVLGTANTPTTTFTFPTAGTYTATLTVSGLGGSNTSAPQTITVNAAVVPPIAGFTMDTNTGTVPLTVNFTNASTGDNLTYTWDFGDSSPAVTDANPSHVYNQAGTYNVTLTATNSAGTNTTAPQVITVNAAVAAPIANFTVDTNTGTAPLTVTFTNASTGDNPTYEWNFGDGSPVSTDANPSHDYTVAGTYNVTLTATNSAGTNTSAPQTVTVNAAPVVPVPPPINHSMVFVSDRSGNAEIYTLSTDGTLTNISNNPASDTSPAWSPDGNQIVFVSDRDGNYEIYVMDVDGANVVRLTNDPATDATPMWTATGIVFTTNRDGNYEIYLMNKDGSNPVNVTNAPSNETTPAPAPDGSRIAYMSDRDGNNEIYTTSSDTTVSNLTNSPSSTDSNPSWANGSQRLVFVSDREGLAQLYIMGVDGSNPTRISDLSKPDTHPSWSPDGSQIAFVSQDNSLSQIYVMSQDGTGITKVSDGTANDSEPAWKP